MTAVVVESGIVQMSAQAIDPNVTHIYGITLPATSVVDEHANLTSQQKEYDSWEIHDIDLTGLPAKANHKDDEVMQPVGKIIAYEPLEREARVLIGLDPHSFEGAMAETAATTGFYGSLSLAHHFSTSANIAAATNGDSGMPAIDTTTRKTALEVSLCRVPARPGAKMLEVCPSKAALLRQPHEFLRRFAERYGYPAPPDVSPDKAARGMVTEQLALNTPALGAYVRDSLSPLVQARLAKIVESAKFVRRCTISPGECKQSVTIDSGTVKMSSGNAGAGMQSSSGAPATSAAAATTNNHPSSDSMHLDAPAGGGNSKQTDAKSGSTTQAGGSASAEKRTTTAGGSASAEKRTTPAGATTESKVSEKVLEAEDDPQSLMLKMHTEVMDLQQQLKAYKEKEAADKKAQEEERARKQKEQLQATDISTQTAIAQLAESLGMGEEGKKDLDEAYLQMRGVMDKAGTPPEERLEMMRKWMSSTVTASKKKKTIDKEEQDLATRALARNIAEQRKANSSSAVMHGGYSHDGYHAASSSTTPATSNTNSGNSMQVDDSVMQTARKQAKMFGISDDEFDLQAHRREYEQRMASKAGASKQEGVVNASGGASTTGRRGGADEIDLDDPDAPRKIYMSLITLTPDGNLELPSYDEVAYGGTKIESVVKRSLTGETIEQAVARPRLKQPWKIGVQTLFPDVFKKIVAPMQSIDSPLPERDLMKMHSLGTVHARQSIIPEVVSRRRKGNYTNNFYYLDPRRRGTEAMADMDIRQVPLMADSR